MRILFISGEDQHYGTYHMSIQLIKNIQKLSKDCHFIVVTHKNGPLNNWCNENEIENYVIPYRNCVYMPPDNRIWRFIKRILKTIYVSVFNAYAVIKIGKMGIIPGVDIIHSNINRDLFGCYLSKKYNIPNIEYLREFYKLHFNLGMVYQNQIELMNSYTTRFIAVSNAVRADWISCGLDANKIDVIYDGVDVNEYKGIAKKKPHTDGLHIVMCAALYEGKGQHEILEAVIPLIKSGYNIHLDFYGESVDNNYVAKLKRRVFQCELTNNIIFKGYSTNIIEILSNYDAGVICSKAEGFGIVTIEYLLSGLTVVASNTGANPELVQNGKYGYIYPLGDIARLRDIIVLVYKRTMDKNCCDDNDTITAINYAKAHFSSADTAANVLRLYSTVVRRINE